MNIKEILDKHLKWLKDEEGGEIGISQHDHKTEYKAGEIVRPDKWDDNRWEECSSGIHFFITRLEAERY